MQLHLIRHGQTDWNQARRVQGQSESRLTEQGKQQALQLRSRLGDFEFHKIYCSSSTRTRETAGCLFPDRLSEINYMDELREIELGPWEGQLYAEVEVHSPLDYQHFWNAPDQFHVPGAETFVNLQQRGLKAIEHIVADNDSDNVAVVSHGAIIKAILCHYEGRHLKRLWEPPQMHNCAHSTIEVNRDGAGHILRYADISWPESPGSG